MSRSMPGTLATALLTALALVAFAANSVICRTALGGRFIDAPAFGLIRLATGALTLLALQAGSRRPVRVAFGVVQPVMLFLYVTGFSFAYLSLSAGTGALVLFGCVQSTMLLAALRSGERFHVLEIAGLLFALGGLGVLVAPGVTAPSPLGAALMAIAGVAWGVYSLKGRGSADALRDTARNFVLATPLALAVVAFTSRGLHVSPAGAALAATSGALTSGVGYVIWFAALRGLTAIRAAVVQLAVPALVAAAGVLFLDERLTPRLVVSGVLILGGVGLAVGRHHRWIKTSFPRAPDAPASTPTSRSSGSP